MTSCGHRTRCPDAPSTEEPALKTTPRHRSEVTAEQGAPVNTRTIAVVALVLVVIVLAILLF